MAIAGKVAIAPKGEWNAQTAYTKLDLVFYENASYVAIQPSTGVEPTNEFYWMLMVQSAGGADLEGIIDGIIQVGNAKTLDGHEAEYFMPTRPTTLTTSIKEKARSLPDGTYFYHLGGTAYTGNDLPSTNWYYGSALIVKRNQNSIEVVLFTEIGKMAVSAYNGQAWTDWKVFASEADLAKYLPLTGGTVKTANRRAMNVSNTGGADVSIGYRHGDTLLGEIGVKDSGAYYIDSSNKVNTLLHTGNKPTGTYTGNGSATQRIINTGGTGNACLVWSDNGTALISFTGSLLYASSGINALGGDGATFRNNNILLYTTDNKLNANGVTYNYQVL